jgi:hypothetical protein
VFDAAMRQTVRDRVEIEIALAAGDGAGPALGGVPAAS